MWDIPKTIEAVTEVVGKFVPDRDKQMALANELQVKLLDQQQRQLDAQTEINKVEAQSSSVFVAGWRPAVGWVCVSGLAWSFLLAPVSGYAAALAGNKTPLPSVNTDQLFQLLLALLGMAGWRTLEKVKGVAR